MPVHKASPWLDRRQFEVHRRFTSLPSLIFTLHSGYRCGIGVILRCKNVVQSVLIAEPEAIWSVQSCLLWSGVNLVTDMFLEHVKFLMSGRILTSPSRHDTEPLSKSHNVCRGCVLFRDRFCVFACVWASFHTKFSSRWRTLGDSDAFPWM